ncbi:MAG: DUF1858 domain-containing protein [Candidatus Mcinerneyibacterium aminivorans]|uniref:DUF1858 domain-containing protein n=1 Tax=Candidatus Mcinerneyibacterium aminivorans TaxID=2703815 RepID=A0A5D0MAX6_9BACT|nr:MAG: DUF1858 domain-containing protein [Candidatus Mcinerneyibacterium aminivorans]
MAKITKDMQLKEIISKYPEIAQELQKMGLGCVGCFAAQFETLEQGLRVHGMNVDDVVKKLNETLNEDEE